MTTTSLHPISLAAIRSHQPCEDGWTKLLRSLGSPPKSAWATTYVTLGDIASSNGAADAWWCVRALPAEARRDVVRALLPSVRRAAVHTSDARVHDSIAVVGHWVETGEGDLASALASAWASAWAAARAAEAAEAAAWAAEAAEAAAWAERAAARAAEAAEAAAWAAVDVADAEAIERQSQVSDIITVFGRVQASADATAA